MALHSSTLAWKIPWTEEPGSLQSLVSLRVGDNWATSFSLLTFMHWRRKWQPTPVFLPGEFQGQRSLVGCHLWGRTESDTTEVISSSSSMYIKLSPFVTLTLFSLSWVYFCFVNKFICIIFNSTYKWCHMLLVILFLTFHLALIIPRSIQVAANYFIAALIRIDKTRKQSKCSSTVNG